jgi:hypothetical protein
LARTGIDGELDVLRETFLALLDVGEPDEAVETMRSIEAAQNRYGHCRAGMAGGSVLLSVC